MGDDIATNRKAHRDFEILETYEAGIALKGSEVKSIRLGHIQMNDAFARVEKGEIWLYQMEISPYLQANRFNHEPKGPRKLLMRKRELTKFLNAIRRKGMTLVPLKIYFNAKGRAKVELGLGRGKRNVDKRSAIKDRDWQRDKARLMRDKG